MKVALLHKFPHWSEILSVLRHGDVPCEFVGHKKGVEYTDPLGSVHITQPKSSFSHEDVMLVNGSIHLETHILNRGKIPYTSFPYKIAIEHTTGYSPWDHLQMTDLAEISRSKSEDAQGSKVLFAMNNKFYTRFMSTDWTKYNKDYYEVYKEKINSLVEDHYIIPTYLEPAQFWLENVPVTNTDVSDHICLCLNWCNLNKVFKVKKIKEICEDLYNYTGKHIDIRTHSYSREGLFHYLEELPYVTLYPYESISKYEIMDKYSLYFVDGTGLGYEIAYRNKFNSRKVDIFYLSGLNSDLPKEGFDGIVEMNAVPTYDYKDFIKGQHTSNFDHSVIRESFPHKPGEVVRDFEGVIKSLSEIVKTLN